MKKNYGKLALFIAVAILTLSIASTGFAANSMVNLKAYYRNVKVFKNGVQAQFSSEPFIVDDTTYVPLRDISQLLDKDVTWDGKTYNIGINDKPGFNTSELQAQVAAQQIIISQLEAKIKTLEADLETTSSISSIKEMERYLNDEYGVYEKIYFDIDLSETKSKIKVEIYVDLDREYSRWNDLATRDIDNYLQDIVDDISDAFSSQTISGFIEDSSEREELVSFTVSSRGKVSTTEYSSSSRDIEDVEKDLDRKYASTKNGIKSVELYSSKSKLYLTLYANKSDWDRSLTTKQYDILEDMYKDIKDYFDETIYGEIRDDYNGSVLYDFDYSSKGKATTYSK